MAKKSSEDTPAEIKADKKQAKKKGQSFKAFEKSAADKDAPKVSRKK